MSGLALCEALLDAGGRPGFNLVRLARARNSGVPSAGEVTPRVDWAVTCALHKTFIAWNRQLMPLCPISMDEKYVRKFVDKSEG